MVSSPIQSQQFSGWLAAAARESGAHAAACLRLENPLLLRHIATHNQRIADWLARGGHAQMDYLERMFPQRADPRTTFPFARSVIVVTFTNRWGDSTAGHPFPTPLTGSPVGYISAYARETDYHQIGHRILAALQQKLGAQRQTVAAVDTRPVYETLFASVGGLGLIGQNGLLRTPTLGTRVFVACLFIDLPLPEVIHEPQMPFPCSSCRACLDNCPSGAITADRPIAAGRCISYLSIEKKAILTAAEAATIGDWLFGCDCCTAVCPPEPAADRRIPVDLDWLLRSPAAEIRRTLKGNATAYAGVSRLRRNAVVVLNNLATERAHKLQSWVWQNSGSQLVRQQIDELGGPV